MDIKNAKMEDKTMEYIKEFDEDEDFMVYPMAPERCTENDVINVEKTLGIKLPEEYKAHILGEIEGGIQVEVDEEVWLFKTNI